MKFTDFISAARVETKASYDGKRSVVKALARLIAGDTSIEPDTVSDALGAREKLGSTAIGKGVAIPHAKLAELDRPVIAIILLRDELDFEAPDDEPVDIVFGIVTPPEATDVQMIAQFAKYLRDPKFLNGLRTAATPQDVIDFLQVKCVLPPE
ncbi:PTS sugar transporter subunit IIA [Aliihoeflea sp. PC F10.4]